MTLKHFQIQVKENILNPDIEINSYQKSESSSELSPSYKRKQGRGQPDSFINSFTVISQKSYQTDFHCICRWWY